MGVARHILGQRSGRSHFGPLYQRGGPLAHTLAFKDDADEDDDDSDPDDEFEGKVLKSVNRIEKRQKSVLDDVGRIDGTLKTALEDLTKLKTSANDQQANHDKFVKTLKQIDTLVRRENRAAFGDPIARISGDEEMRIRFNVAMRVALSKTENGEAVGKRLAEAFKDVTGKSLKDVLVERALGEDSSPGSTLIDDRLAREIYDTIASFGVWNTFQVVQVGTNQTKFPVKTARATANFILTEGGTVSDASITGTSVTNTMEVIAALINVSMQLIEDSEFDITSYVLDDFGEAYSERLDFACLNADGTADATNGGMTGVFQGGTAATADAGAGADDTVEELEFEDFTRCLLTVDPIVLNRAARWWMHPQILVRALSIKDSNGRPIFLTALEAPAPRAVGSILGYPVTPAFKAPNTNAASAKVATFGDPRGMVVGIRRAFTFEASDHHRWNTLERSFRGWGRAGTKIRRALAFAVLTLGA